MGVVNPALRGILMTTYNVRASMDTTQVNAVTAFNSDDATPALLHLQTLLGDYTVELG